jgi:hypothetical protein
LNNKDNEKSNELLNRAYNCKLNNFDSLLKEIELELNKNKDNETVLRAKRVITSRMASNKN